MALRHEVFHALGDATRLEIVRRLGENGPQPTGELLEGLGMSRQAATKHLKLLEDAKVVKKKIAGRRVVRSLHADALDQAGTWLTQRAAAWDRKLDALKKYVEGS